MSIYPDWLEAMEISTAQQTIYGTDLVVRLSEDIFSVDLADVTLEAVLANSTLEATFT